MPAPSPPASTPWQVIGDLPCLGRAADKPCAYNLRGTVGPLVVCPECGYTNDLTQPLYWVEVFHPLATGESKKNIKDVGLLGMLVAIVVPPVLTGMGYAVIEDEWLAVFLLSLLAVPMSAAWVLLLRKVMRAPVRKRLIRRLLVGIHILPGLFVLLFYGGLGLTAWLRSPIPLVITMTMGIPLYFVIRRRWIQPMTSLLSLAKNDDFQLPVHHPNHSLPATQPQERA